LRAGGYFRVFDETARQRFSSPTIDLGDPRADQALPAAYQNLLANGDFESGLTGWTPLPSGAVQTVSPAPWTGASYFFASSNQVTTLDQSIGLIAAGFTPAVIDTRAQTWYLGSRAIRR
jgi:hypothetical protein